MNFDQFKEEYISLAKSHGFDGCFIGDEIVVKFKDGIKNLGKQTNGIRFGSVRNVDGIDYSSAFERIKNHFLKYIPQMNDRNITVKP